MKANMSTADRIVRIVIAAVFLILGFTGTVTGALAVILYVLAGIFVLTSIAGFCPLYALLRIRTKKA